jgi:hypothetical protein
LLSRGHVLLGILKRCREFANANLPAQQLRQQRVAQGGEGGWDGMAGFSRRMASRKRPTSTTSENESRSAAGSPGARCGPCPTA